MLKKPGLNTDFRPVSNLTFMSKIMEKAVSRCPRVGIHVTRRRFAPALPIGLLETTLDGHSYDPHFI